MEFKKIDVTNDDLRWGVLYKEYSSDDKIEISVCTVLYGYRVKVRFVDAMDYLHDYCAGSIQENVEMLFAQVRAVLERYEPKMIHTIGWPKENIRPIFNDPIVYPLVCEFAGEVEPEDLPQLSLLKAQTFRASGIERMLSNINNNS
jgi:hypothetical protein